MVQGVKITTRRTRSLPPRHKLQPPLLLLSAQFGCGLEGSAGIKAEGGREEARRPCRQLAMAPAGLIGPSRRARATRTKMRMATATRVLAVLVGVSPSLGSVCCHCRLAARVPLTRPISNLIILKYTTSLTPRVPSSCSHPTSFSLPRSLLTPTCLACRIASCSPIDTRSSLDLRSSRQTPQALQPPLTLTALALLSCLHQRMRVSSPPSRRPSSNRFSLRTRP